MNFLTSAYQSNHLQNNSLSSDQPCDRTQAAPSSAKNFEKYEVNIENENIDDELKLMKWRSQTEFPISKILFYKVLEKKRCG